MLYTGKRIGYYTPYMWEFLERAVQNRASNNSRNHTEPLSDVFRLEYPRRLNTLETVAAKKKLHERLSNNSTNH